MALPHDSEIARLFEAVRNFAPRQGRYSRAKSIAETAMSVIVQARDGLLERSVVIKELKSQDDGDEVASARRLRRFLDEARITSQLDHPSIVPVHDIGVDENGTPYFAMKLVRGESLTRSFERERAGEEGWSQTRMVGVLLKVCEAMSYAHQKQVLHRDLKPGNVMVGRFGEVYVMDWGLAHMLGTPDTKDLRLREPDAGSTVIKALDDGDDSPLVTMDGDIVGTPAYMSPEQAHAQRAEIGPHSDIYSLGAILYHLLAGHMPYVPPFSRVNVYTLLRFVREGAPADLAILAPDAPPELIAICNKAMAREPARRFASMAEFADELRRYLDGRVVLSHRTGPLIELKKWIARNRMAAAGLGTAALLVTAWWGTVWRNREVEAAEVQRELDARKVVDLIASVDRLRANSPDAVEEIEDWISSANEMLARRVHSNGADAPSAAGAEDDRGAEWDEAQDAATRAQELHDAHFETQQMFLEADPSPWLVRLADLDRTVRPTEAAWWRFKAEAAARRTTWKRATEQFELAATPEAARRAIAALKLEILEVDSLPKALDQRALALEIRARNLSDRDRWTSTMDSIADQRDNVRYGGLELPVQFGLAPLRRDPQSGLWEFLLLGTGSEPELEADGSWSITGATGVILVLIPGCIATIGAQYEDPGAPRYDLEAARSKTEGLWTVELEPYLLAKYELTQGQWRRMSGEHPSEHFAGRSYMTGDFMTAANPVENVSYDECVRVLERWGLTLPTEAQWEHAQRGGSDWPYWTGPNVVELLAMCNHADRIHLESDPATVARADDLSDGFRLHVRVGSFPANGFGLHDMSGNVAEWCLDLYNANRPDCPVRPGDGLRTPPWGRTRVVRGGGFRTLPGALRSSARSHKDPRMRGDDLGVRPARSIVH